MFTGGYNENNSPEARNARPFYNLLPNKRGDEAEGPVDELVAHDESFAPVKPVETLNVEMGGVQPDEVANEDTPRSIISAPLHPDSPSDAPHEGENK